MDILVKKEEEACLFPFNSLKEAPDWKEIKPRVTLPVEIPSKVEDEKPITPKQRLRFFMDAVVITSRPQGTLGPRLPQVKGLGATRPKKEEEALSSVPLTITKVEVTPQKGQRKSKKNTKQQQPPSSVASKTKVEAGALVLQNVHRQVSTPATVRIESPEPGLPETTKVLERKMKSWKNPKVKAKREPIELTNDTIISRISAAGISFDLFPIAFPKADQDVMVSRAFMAAYWGGSSQDTWPKIGKKNLARHGLNDFMYMPSDYQPIAPQVPGAPGLWLNIGSDIREWDGGVKRVFTKITSKPRALWLYQGQYEFKLAKELTREEWARQTPKVRNTWARELFNQSWGVDCRAEIWARRYWGRLPTEDEIREICARGDHNEITKEDISLSLTRGETYMPVYTMKCVGYDTAFQREIVQKVATYGLDVPSQPVAGRKRKVEKDSESPEPKERKPAKRQKLKKDVIDVDGLELQEEWPVRSRGTKSRPAKRP